MQTKIILVDDHTLVRNAIADLIEGNPDYIVTHQAGNGKELFEILANPNSIPDIILLDVNMPIMDGFATMEKLQIEFPDIHVLALSMNDDDETIIKMMKFGACGYISKLIKEEELILAIDTVVKKGYYYTNEVTNLIVGNFKQKPNKNEVHFTEREKELLQYICTEMTYKEIADKMFLSPKTIDGYRDDLFQKLNIKSRVGLAVYAMRNGFYNL
ncbi:MAG TPA: response regulator transcription factor [Chitinophagaceae bacterium]|nr:response regulator transcription factor [Chitinophagaceae bacterium]